MDVTWAPLRLQSPAVRQVAQQVVQTNSKENNKVPYNWPFVMGIPITLSCLAISLKLSFLQTFSTNGFTIQHAWNHCNSLLFLKCDRDPCCLAACCNYRSTPKDLSRHTVPKDKIFSELIGHQDIGLSNGHSVRFIWHVIKWLSVFWREWHQCFSISAVLNRLHMPGMK